MVLDVCPDCAKLPVLKRKNWEETYRGAEAIQPKERYDRLPLVTSETYVKGDLCIIEHLPAVTSMRAYSFNILQEISADLRDLIGGKAGTVQAAMERIEADLLDEISIKSEQSGADAVVCLRLQFYEIGDSRRGRTLIAFASGTPVILSDQE